MPHAPAPGNPPTNRHLTFPARCHIQPGRRIIPREPKHREQAPIQLGQRLMSRATIAKEPTAPGAFPTGHRHIPAGMITRGTNATMIAAQRPGNRLNPPTTNNRGSHIPAGYGNNSRVKLLSTSTRNPPPSPTNSNPLCQGHRQRPATDCRQSGRGGRNDRAARKQKRRIPPKH